MFFYTVSNPNDPLSTEIIKANRRELEFWQSLKPDDNEDLATVINKINARSGLARKFIAACLFSMCMLPHLPKFHELLKDLSHLDMARINTITKTARKIPSEKRALFDAYLVSYLTPTREAQALPQAPSIAAMLRKFIAIQCPPAEAPTVEKPYTIRYRRNKNDSISITVDTAEDEAIEIKTALEHMVKDKDCAPGSALLNLVRGLTTKVVLNTYGAGDCPEYLEGGYWLTAKQQAFWKERVTSFRDMDKAEFAFTDAYAPTPEIRLFVKGKFTTCSVPGCCVDVKNCQLDHIIPWKDGGPTTVWNLHPLCVFHHIQKTEGRLKCYPLPNGDILFIIDGLPITTTPDGPLSRSHRSWGTTFGAYMNRQIAA